ncbi:MAG: Hsp20/alpha crystallin family protein [Chloroflexi bacterium]|nr:Hsp20/alpha crystallin family protein [Chloroflexota bacterium]
MQLLFEYTIAVWYDEFNAFYQSQVGISMFFGQPDDEFSKLLSTLEAVYTHSLVQRRGGKPAAWRPPTDVYEADDRLIVCVEIAGMRDGEFHITIDERLLVISGVRIRDYEHPQPSLHQLEIRHGEFRVELMLPWAVDRSRIEANYRDGFLQVELPRRQDRQIHIINVRIDENDEE